MREIKPTKKSFLAKIFIKLCRVLGFEIIDQSNLSIPTSKKSLIEGISIHSRNSVNESINTITNNYRNFIK